ncbi:MAG: Arm DNA-binding domain-containing protein [Sphingomonas phyllosphaerae]
MATAAGTVKVGHQSARERLTDKRVEKLTAPAGKRVEIGDTIVRELRIRVSDKGAKSWSLLYRVAGAGDGETRGAMKRMTLGAYPLVSLEKAREKARAALDAADRGVDPAAQRGEELAQRKVRTFAAVFERFVDLHVKQNTKEGRFAKDRAAALAAAHEGKAKPKGPNGKLGRVAAERIIADNALPLWRDRLIETITRAEVHDLLDDLVTDKGEALVFLHVDVDPRKGEDVASEQARILKSLNDFSPSPSVVVFSGGGYQALWRLDEPLYIGGTAERWTDVEAHPPQRRAQGGLHRRARPPRHSEPRRPRGIAAHRQPDGLPFDLRRRAPARPRVRLGVGRGRRDRAGRGRVRDLPPVDRGRRRARVRRPLQRADRRHRPPVQRPPPRIARPRPAARLPRRRRSQRQQARHPRR